MSDERICIRPQLTITQSARGIVGLLRMFAQPHVVRTPFHNQEGEVSMKRKVVSCVLVASLSFSIGCYSTEMVTMKEFRATPYQVDITLFTRDSLQYKFLKENYWIQGDTVKGFGVRRANVTSEIVSDASLSFADIDSIETKKFDARKTFLLLGGIGVGAVLIIAILSRRNQDVMGYISGPSGKMRNECRKSLNDCHIRKQAHISQQGR
jgi:hypothetical protein